MRLLSLELRQFRNYSEQTVRLGAEDIQLFLGRNGSGKTNLLEAVSILSVTRSCRGRDDDEIVQWGQNFYRIIAEVVSDTGQASRLEVVCELSPRRRKAFFINDVRTPVTGIVGFLPTVTFLPQDLELFTGPPAERRRFLDQLLSQLSPDYLMALSHYQKLVSQRNALLKRLGAGNDSESSLDLWDQEVSGKGAQVTLARLELVETLNLSFAEELSSLGETWNDVQLRYDRKGKERELPAMQSELKHLLKEQRQRDILLQSTGVGPHREDWQIWRGPRMLPAFASRGQERTAVLALLQLQVSYLELRKNERPVILLDDAFSELDDEHQKLLLQGFGNRQTLMTATRVPSTDHAAHIFTVETGMIL